MHPAIFTLEEVLQKNYALSGHGREFIEGLLVQGPVLVVRPGYLLWPEALVWLVTTAAQAWRMREHGAVAYTLGEAQDFLTAVGDPAPSTLQQVAERLLFPAPAEPWTDLNVESDGDIEPR